MKKKILAMLMIMIMCVPFVTPIQANAASQAYREWSQADPEWGSIHLGASQYTMKSSGCLVTAIAMLCHRQSPHTFQTPTSDAQKEQKSHPP